ncbi:hypothetical protein ATY76_14285 [Rhizobium sp. R339]|uniref:DUF1819 family protein n=1 Tax=Rhizobium sp. R339 TaxID=1764273 RepID=UPI000B5308A0|nr:DUF1819 family protein [Rhizobium sp. R339]OWV68071.1 hypothetical protein ATY76_14285 [Rhizobium sp. R339]
MTSATPYKFSFVTGGLFRNESHEVARTFERIEDWARTIDDCTERAVTALPKTASNRRAVREIAQRLQLLTAAERHYFVEVDDRDERDYVLWLSVCRAYRIIYEFAVEVVRERYLSFTLDLTGEMFDRFVAAKAEWEPHLARLKPSTIKKSQQVLFRMMREAGVINDASRIQPIQPSVRLQTIIAQHHQTDLLIFPGVRGRN